MTVMTRRWLARASFALMLAAVALVLAVAGWRSLTLVAFAAVGVCAVLAGGYWFLANRGVLRWLALVLVVAAPVLILVAFAWHHLVWVAVVAVALMVAAAGAARAALSTGGQDAAMPAVPAARPRRPFVIMNPRSGGGKVTKFGLKEKAETLGAEVALLEGPGTVDVAALARQAVADGADLLGVAGGDGTQALVAGIAAEHGLPFLVISAGTRNHFALDLGLDREDPATCLDALTDGEELRVDLGIIADRTFVNNASFGAYAEVVRSPAYRDDKRGTTLQMLPDLLKGHQGARLSAQAGGTRIEGPQALLVSNDPYGMGDVAGLGRRARLDAGTLGVVAVRVDSARQAAGLLRRGHGTGLTALTAERGHRRRRRAPDPGRHRRRDGHAAHPGPLHHPAPGAPRGRAPATARRSRPQAAPGMAAAAATRLLPPPARRRIPSPPRQTESQARNHGRRRPADLGTLPVRWSGEPFIHRPGSPVMPGLGRAVRPEQRSSLLGDVRSAMAPQDMGHQGARGEPWEGSRWPVIEYEPGAAFPGVIGRTADESTPAWPAPVRAREGAPNVLFIVLDDTGFGQLGCYGSPIADAQLRRARGGRPALQQHAHDGVVLAEPVVHPDRPQPSQQRDGRHHRAGERLSRVQRRDPVRERLPVRDAGRARLQHVPGREVPPDAEQPGDGRGPV